jgi:hypothetical protein
MVLIRHILLRIIVVIISFSTINGGGSLLIDKQDISILIGHNHLSDTESPHQHHILTFHDEEKILQSSSFDFSCSDINSPKFLSILISPTKDFSDSVWQPPRLA